MHGAWRVFRGIAYISMIVVQLEFGQEGMELLLVVYDLGKRIERQRGLYLLLLGFWSRRRCCICWMISRICELATERTSEARAARQTSPERVSEERRIEPERLNAASERAREGGGARW